MSDYSERKKKKEQKTINPHSYPHRSTTEGGGMEPLPGVFDIFLILPLVQSQFRSS